MIHFLAALHPFLGKVPFIVLFQEECELHFCAKTIAMSLGYSDSNWKKNIYRHCKSVCTIQNRGRDVVLISELDVIRLAYRSEYPEVEKLIAWLWKQKSRVIDRYETHHYSGM